MGLNITDRDPADECTCGCQGCFLCSGEANQQVTFYKNGRVEKIVMMCGQCIQGGAVK